MAVSPRPRSFAVAFLALALAPSAARAGDAPEASADATRVRVLLVGDTRDADIGPSVATDLKTMRGALDEGIPEARRSVAALEGADATPATVLARVGDLDVLPTDSLVLYYAGHGAWSDAGPYLRMDGGKILPRADLVKALEAKGARLTVLLTDCCSTYVGKAALYAPPQPDPTVWRDLFFRHRGLVDLTAAEKGEVAVGDGLLGGFFTHALVGTLTLVPRGELDADADGIVSWAELAAALKKETQGVWKMLHPRGLAVRGETRFGQTPFVFGDLATPAGPPIPRAKLRLGVRVADAAGQGARIEEVVPETPADWMGLRVGQVFVSLRTQDGPREMNFPVTDAASFRAALAKIAGPALLACEVRDPSNPPPAGVLAARPVWIRLSF